MSLHPAFCPTLGCAPQLPNKLSIEFCNDSNDRTPDTRNDPVAEARVSFLDIPLNQNDFGIRVALQKLFGEQNAR